MANTPSRVPTPKEPLSTPQQDLETLPSPEWSDPNDPDNPFNWPLRKKWLVTFLTCYVTLIVGINSTSPAAITHLTNPYFHISDASFPHSFWSITAWNTGAALAPMLVLPLMENYGMRPGYLASYALFAVFVIPQAVARDYATFVAVRAVAGSAGGVLQDVMDGVIADVWPDALQRSLPVTVYVFALLAGVTLGPILGGAVAEGGLDWRWVFYIQLIIYGASVPLVLLFKETRGPVILAKRTKRSQKPADEATPPPSAPPLNPTTRLKTFIYDALGRPTILLITEPVVLSFTLLSALSYGLVFLSTQSIPQVYSALYGFSLPHSSLLQLSLLIGEILAFPACLAQNAFFARSVHTSPSGSANPLLEKRLYIAILGSFLGLAGGLFLYGATSSTSVPWIAPTVGLALIGFGSVTVMQAIMVYITDAYAQYAGSASAAVCFGENMFAAFLPLAAQSLYGGLGFRWASWLLGFVAVGLGVAPVALLVSGGRVRGRSRFMLEAGV